MRNVACLYDTNREDNEGLRWSQETYLEAKVARNLTMMHGNKR